MGKGTIGGKIVLEGENQYRTALKNIKSEQSELRSEMRLCQSTFADNQNSLEALQKKHEILTKQISSQTAKVEVYQQAMQTSAEKEKAAADNIADYKKALEIAEKEMNELASCTGATTEALEEKAKAVEEVKNKLALAEQDYDKAAQKTNGYRTAVNNAQAELQGMQNKLEQTEKYIEEASGSTDKCATSIDEYGKVVKEASEETLSFGDVLKANLASDLIVNGLENLLDLAKQVGEEFVNCAVGAAQYADDIATTATNTGIAAETLQELTYAQELMDVSLDTVTGTMAKNIKSMDSARKGSADYVEAYEKLGVAITDNEGKMRDSETVFWEVVDALGKMKNETERDATAMKVFGRSAQDLNSLIAIGSKGFKELAAEAHESGFVLSDEVLSGLLDTSDAMEIMNNRITAAKNRIGSELAPVLTQSLGKIGDVVDVASDGVIDFAEDAIPKLVVGMEWIVENSEIVAAGIGGITTATMYHSAVGPAIATVTGAWQAYKAANEGATVSQWLLNTAMNANPAGALVTAIVALGGALATYALVTKDAKSETSAWAEEIDNVIASSNAINETVAQSAEMRAKDAESTEAQAGVCKKLAHELADLQAKTLLTVTEEQKQKQIVDQLNSAMPELNLAIDEQTGILNMSTEELLRNVEAMSLRAKATAAEERLTEIAREKLDVEVELTKLENERAANAERIAQAEKYLYNENTSLADYEKYGEIYDEAVAKQEELNTAIEETQNTVNALGVEYDTTCSYLDDTESLETATAATQELGETAENTGTQIEEMSEEAIAAYEEMKEGLKDTIESQIDLFSEFSAETKLSTDEILKNMQSQVDGITQWSENIALLADKGINQGLLQYLSDMGPQGAGYVATFVQMTDEELKKANQLYQESLLLPSDTAGEIMSSWEKAGLQATDGYTKAIEGQEESIRRAAGQSGNWSLSALEEELETSNGSASGKTEKIGLQFDEGLQTGIKNGEEDVITTVTGVTKDIVDTTSSGLDSATFETIGEGMTEGIQKGMESKKGDLLNAVNQMCTEAQNTAKGAVEDVQSTVQNQNVMAQADNRKDIIGRTKSISAQVNSIVEMAAVFKGSEAVSAKDDALTLLANTESALQSVVADMDARYSEFVENAMTQLATNIIVKLEGEAAGVFRIVEIECDKATISSGRSPLAKTPRELIR